MPDRSSLFIGRHAYDGFTGHFRGSLQDIRIYNRALSNKEIKLVFDEGNCKPYYYADTASVFTADITFKGKKDIVALDKSETFLIKGGCDSTIESYIQFEYKPRVFSDTIKVFDTTLVSVTDTLIIDLTTVGQNINQKNTLKVYPNPTKGQVIIDNGDFQLMKSFHVKILTSTGQIVFANFIDQQQFLIDISKFGGKGLYFLQLYDPNNELIERRKIVLE